eukprot:676555-Amorphochlora_amoeboformis.AAC.2
MTDGTTQGLSLDSMGGFVYYSLGKILKLSNKSKDKKLRTAAIDVQKQIFTAFQQNREAAKADRDADKYLLPFKLACDYVRPNLKMLHTSLDAIQRMIAYGYLTGDSYVDPQTYPPVELDNQNKNKGEKLPRLIYLLEMNSGSHQDPHHRGAVEVVQCARSLNTSSDPFVLSHLSNRQEHIQPNH